MSTLLLEEMTWPEVKTALDNGYNTVIITTGSIEQHGPHLAELSDTAIAEASALDLAERLGNTLVAPVIRPGLSDHHLALAGTLSLRPEIFAGLIEDYISCYIKHGFKQFILISSHGGNFIALEEIASGMKERNPGYKFVTGLPLDQLLEMLAGIEEDFQLPAGTCGGHACEYETSVMLYLFPKHVRRDKAREGYVGRPTQEILSRMHEGGITAVSASGVLGDPRQAGAERGKKYFELGQETLYKTIKEKLLNY